MQVLVSRHGKLPIMIIAAVLAVVCLAGGAFIFMKGKKGGHKKKEVHLTQWKLEEFVVNLADSDESRYLKACIVLEVESEGKSGGGHGESANPEEAKARDAVISELSKRYLSQLLSEQGKDKLKEDIKTALNSKLEESKVHDVYFTSFAMQ
ncbi:MAG: flagellar basal body-associated FliL family protein [Armatimonadota bacterium]